MGDREAKELLAKAEKKANYNGWFGGKKYDEAAELYVSAANSLKLAKKWKEAGDAFMKAADMQIRAEERDEASSTFISASKCYKKSNPEDAINSLKMAIEILTERGRFHAAAGHQKDIAQIYESDLIDIERAMNSYELAADWYSGEEATAMANNCYLKVAAFAAQLEQYDKAIEKFEQVANASMDNNLTKWSLKEYFLKAGLCHIATNDIVGAQRALERYQDMDVTFSSTREYKFLQSIMEAIDSGDLEAFTNQVFEFDQLTKLDNWKTTMLLRIKKSINEEPTLT
ncbi:vesicular-fusion protein S17 [Basidiobolus ranarum]|uniref:Vesicular-fusion protein S17 n=1 Tax=Basidiobolus ranarum TaxID=34480 RepID=A0ABR2W8W9_9FUNG